MKAPRIPTGTHGPASGLAPLPFTLLCVTALCVLAAHAPHMPVWYAAILAAPIFEEYIKISVTVSHRFLAW